MVKLDRIMERIHIPTIFGGKCASKYIQKNYWWLRSPNTTDSGLAYFVYSDGDVGFNGHIVYSSSYGRKDRRTRTASSVCASCTRMMTSATTTAVSAIPTDVMVAFWIKLLLISNYWWLRSPGTTYDGNYAWRVNPVGVGGGEYGYGSGIWNSYGRILRALLQI